MIVKKVNSFTENLDGGNPAGVVIDTPELTNYQMIYITKTLSVSETAFVFPSKVAAYKIRFFSPKMEVDLCGHATIATFFILAQEETISKKKEKMTLDQETKAGILPVDIYFTEGKVEKVMMTQRKPILKDINLNKKKISKSLNMEISDIDWSLPEQIVSTGLFTIPVCIKSFDKLKAMKPDFYKIKTICKNIGAESVHVFTFETIEETSAYHARNFAPLYGIDEDPVTGTANGAICSYLLKNKVLKSKNLVCEQGDIIGRPGRVYVEIDKNSIKVGGKAKLVEEREFKIG
jgi:trans-2,3-dihydro-3-hydroxyanthranilate isomerase